MSTTQDTKYNNQLLCHPGGAVALTVGSVVGLRGTILNYVIFIRC